MLISAPAIICAILPHSENDVIVRSLTSEYGMMIGYVRGGRSRINRPILIPANQIEGVWRARNDAQLPSLIAELTHSFAPLMGEPLAAAGLDWITALSAAALPEGHPYARLYEALGGVISAIEAAPAARGWATSLCRYELLLLQELGFGLDLSCCAVTGAVSDLRWVSPKSGRAVCKQAGAGYEGRLLALPRFLSTGEGVAPWADVLSGLKLTGHFIAAHVLNDRKADVMAARARLVGRLERVDGISA